MPKVNPKRRKSSTVRNGTQSSNEAESDDEVIPPSMCTSQVTVTQSEKAIKSMSRENVEQLVCELVTYLLISDQNKYPIKRQDINKNVLKENSKAFAGLMNRANVKLETVFGIKLVELEQNRYILVSSIANSAPEEFEQEKHTKRGLLMVILSFILLEGNQLGENELSENLCKIGVDVDVPHEVFGDVRHLINEEFVRQLYLECEKQTAVDPPKIIYRWGARARAETTEQDVLDFMSSICDRDKD